MTVAVVAAVGVAALVTRDSGGSQRVVTKPPDSSVVASLPTPSQSAAPSTIDTTATTAVPVAPSTDSTVDTTPAITNDTATGGPGCRNSTDPQCGPFFYDWAVDNRPASISIVASPSQPKVGETVAFTVTIDDPDGAPISRCYSFNPDTTQVEPSGHALTTGICSDGAPPGYGPWDPPPPWHTAETYEFTYETAGDHVVRYDTEEAGRATSDAVPRASGQLTVNVVPI